MIDVVGDASCDNPQICGLSFVRTVEVAIRNAKGGTIGEAIKAAKDKPLAEHGEIGNGRKEESRVDNVNSTKGGNDTDYTLRRLARDNPAMLDKIEAGELSVNAAAIQAGIRKKPTPTVQSSRTCWLGSGRRGNGDRRWTRN